MEIKKPRLEDRISTDRRSLPGLAIISWMSIRTIAAVIAMVAPITIFGQERALSSSPTVWVSGRLLDADGLPVVSARLSARSESLGTLACDAPDNVVSKETDKSGRFTIQCPSFHTFKLEAHVKGLNLLTKLFDVQDLNVNLGDLRFDEFKNWSNPDYAGRLRLDQILVDPQRVSMDGSVWRPLVGDVPHANSGRCESLAGTSENRADWDSLCVLFFQPPVNVEDFVGGTVTNIRVVRVRWSGELAPSDLQLIREEVRRVWFTKFWLPSPFMAWREPTKWSLEAVAEFTDGSHALIRMDDLEHMQVQDHEGRFWFILLQVQ